MNISHYLRMGVGRRDYKGAGENLFAGDGHVHYIAIMMVSLYIHCQSLSNWTSTLNTCS